jgi:transcriptional regulator with XRE-family HTH domain
MLRLRLTRLSRGLSQAEMARQLRMSHLTLGYLENGRLAPSQRDLERLRAVFGSMPRACLRKSETDSESHREARLSRPHCRGTAG